MIQIWAEHSLHTKYDLHELKFLLLFVIETSSLWPCMFRFSEAGTPVPKHVGAACCIFVCI
jgi:hypothetical protein